MKSSESGDIWVLLKKIMGVKDLLVFALYLLGLAYIVFSVFNELRDKPDINQVNQAINARVAPVEEVVGGQSAKLERLERKVDKLESGTNEILDEVKFQSTVLDCLAEKCKQPPKRTPRLFSTTTGGGPDAQP